MSEEAEMNRGLATAVANPTAGDYAALRKQLESLSQDAIEVGKAIASRSEDINALWDKLLPILLEVKQFLSKQSKIKDRRFAESLTWQQWRRWFLKESGLRVSDRTAQRHLKDFEALMSGATKKGSSQSSSTTSAERYQMLAAQRAADELVTALEEGDDISAAIEKYWAIRIDPDRLTELLRKTNKPHGFEGSLNQRSTSRAASTNSVTPFLLQRRAPSECGLKFHPGGTALLAEFISVEHREQAEIVFGHLPPEQKWNAFRDLMTTLAQTFLRVEGVDDREIYNFLDHLLRHVNAA